MLSIADTQSELMDCLLDMGQLLLSCGAEISRVEDTVSRMGMAYGAEQVDAFVITSIISLSMKFPGREAVTETRRIYSSSGNDFYRLEKLNDLSRRCCASPLPVSELHEKLRHIDAGRKPMSVILIGSFLGASSFALFFGGSPADALVSGIFALGICFLQKALAKTKINPVGENLLLSFVTGLAAGLLCATLPSLSMDMIFIGDIMLLIPGLAITNSVRNMLVGDTISGVIRLTECLIWACALAGGFMTALLLLRIILKAV